MWTCQLCHVCTRVAISYTNHPAGSSVGNASLRARSPGGVPTALDHQAVLDDLRGRQSSQRRDATRLADDLLWAWSDGGGWQGSSDGYHAAASCTGDWRAARGGDRDRG